MEPSAPARMGSAPVQMQVDLVGSSRWVVNVTMDILARLSNSGLDTYAFGIAMSVGQSFICSPLGLERFHKALEEGPAHRLFRNVVQIGLGMQSPLRVLMLREDSSKFAALSACVAEVYSRDAAGQIMHAFVKQWETRTNMSPQDMAEHPVPSLDQVTNLVEKCAGIFAASQFPVEAERFMSVDREAVIGQHAWPFAVKRGRVTRGVASPSNVADALHAIMDVGRRSVSHLTLVGVADAAVVAAIGAWLLGLRIVLYRNEQDADAGRDYLHNYLPGEEPQLTVIYEREYKSQALVQRERTVRLPDCTPLLKTHAEQQPNHDYTLTGRVSWDSALTMTFSSDFDRLCGQTRDFGTALGSAGRILEAIVEADPSVPKEWLAGCQSYFLGSYGVDFAHLLLQKFPEIANYDGLQSVITETVRLQTYNDAAAAFITAIDNLAAECFCDTCTDRGAHNTSRPSLVNKQKQRLTKSWCLVSLVGTIIHLVRGLAGIHVEPKGLYPTRKGIEFIGKVYEARVSCVVKSPFPSETHLNLIVEQGISRQTNREHSLLHLAQVLFRTDSLIESPENLGVTAFSSGGICYYYEILREPTDPDVINSCQVHVLPGQIVYENHLVGAVMERTTSRFMRAHDTKPHRPGRPTQKHSCVPEKVFRKIPNCVGGRVEILITEIQGRNRQPSLMVEFGLVDAQGELVDQVGPAKIVQNYLRGIGLAGCPRNGCTESKKYRDELESLIAKNKFERPVCTLATNGATATLVMDDPCARLLTAWKCWEPMIQRSECLSCCIRTSIANGWKEFAIVYRGLGLNLYNIDIRRLTNGIIK